MYLKYSSYAFCINCYANVFRSEEGSLFFPFKVSKSQRMTVTSEFQFLRIILGGLHLSPLFINHASVTSTIYTFESDSSFALDCDPVERVSAGRIFFTVANDLSACFTVSRASLEVFFLISRMKPCLCRTPDRTTSAANF